MINDDVLEKIETKTTHLRRIRKQQLTFLVHIMRKEDLENVKLTGYIKGKKDRRKQRIA